MSYVRLPMPSDNHLQGVTRRTQLSGNWELVDGPLWSNVKKILLATPMNWFRFGKSITNLY